MSILDIFKIGQIKKELEATIKQKEEYEAILKKTGSMEYAELQLEIERLKREKAETQSGLSQLMNESLKKQQELIVLDDAILMQSFGFYEMKYALNNAQEYKTKIDEIRNRQEEMIKAGTAVTGSQTWTINNSKSEGAKMIRDYVKLILRSFNNECDASILNVKFNNVDSIAKKINKAYEVLTKLGSRMSIRISQSYLNLKLEELFLCHEYQIKKQEEKEEQKKLKEQMREEAKLLKEIEEMKLRIEKEEKHFNQAIEKFKGQIARSKTEDEKQILLEKLHELELKLAEIEKTKKDILNREQNTRAGYVYIISNIGSFGQDVYKIGVTRRLDPTERVDELGDASVPFDFDIHALIFSADAPKLENTLHKSFEHRRLNLINNRREFFKVKLEEIEDVVKKNHSKSVEFERIPQADEFRQSYAIRKNRTTA